MPNPVPVVLEEIQMTSATVLLNADQRPCVHPRHNSADPVGRWSWWRSGRYRAQNIDGLSRTARPLKQQQDSCQDR
jgi:hypothetical protein